MQILESLKLTTTQLTSSRFSFFFKDDWGCALFEPLQDGVLPPLKCPLCPEGVSLSAAQSDRQSGALKAHTHSLFYPASVQENTGSRVSHSHRVTRMNHSAHL